jgi:hypothetical protein
MKGSGSLNKANGDSKEDDLDKKSADRRQE